MDPEEKLISIIRQGKYDEAVSSLKKLNLNEAIDDCGTTWLHIAAESGNRHVVDYLIDNGCAIDAADEFGNTPLILASHNYNASIFSDLCEANASVFASNERGESAAKNIFRSSADCYNHRLLEMLLARMRLERPNDSRFIARKLIEFGCTLPRAISLRDAAVTEYMLDSGRYEVDERDISFPHLTALQRAFACTDADNVRLLIERGADVDSINELASRGYPAREPLGAARDRPSYLLDKWRIFEALLARGVSLTDGFGKPLLEYLLENASGPMIERMLQLNLRLGSREQRFALLDRLVSNANLDPDDAEIRLLRLDLDERRHEVRRRFTRALPQAIKAGNFKSTRFLLRHGADPNACHTSCGKTALFYAFYCIQENKLPAGNALACVKLLLEYGANVQYVGARDRVTIFHLELIREHEYLAPIQFVIAHLVLLKTLGQPIQDFTLNGIQSCYSYINYFCSCEQTIAEMKRDIVHDSITKFDLLALTKSQIPKLAHNEGLVDRIKSMLEHNAEHSQFYYDVIAREHAAKVVQVANLQTRAFQAVAQIQGLRRNAYLIREIASYCIYEEIQKVTA